VTTKVTMASSLVGNCQSRHMAGRRVVGGWEARVVSWKNRCWKEQAFSGLSCLLRV